MQLLLVLLLRLRRRRWRQRKQVQAAMEQPPPPLQVTAAIPPSVCLVATLLGLKCLAGALPQVVQAWRQQQQQKQKLVLLLLPPSLHAPRHRFAQWASSERAFSEIP